MPALVCTVVLCSKLHKPKRDRTTNWSSTGKAFQQHRTLQCATIVGWVLQKTLHIVVPRTWWKFANELGSTARRCQRISSVDTSGKPTADLSEQRYHHDSIAGAVKKRSLWKESFVCDLVLVSQQQVSFLHVAIWSLLRLLLCLSVLITLETSG